ncbi:Metal-dependent hydrolase, partial [Parasponia andersonii]
MPYTAPETSTKIIDSHLHIWASPEEAAGKYPYFPGKEPPLPEISIYCSSNWSDANAINISFSLQLLNSAIKKYPSKFVGCSHANPAEDGSGVKQLEQLVLKGLSFYISEIEELCTESPSTVVLIDHLGYCKPPT